MNWRTPSVDSAHGTMRCTVASCIDSVDKAMPLLCTGDRYDRHSKLHAVVCSAYLLAFVLSHGLNQIDSASDIMCVVKHWKLYTFTNSLTAGKVDHSVKPAIIENVRGCSRMHVNLQ